MTPNGPAELDMLLFAKETSSSPWALRFISSTYSREKLLGDKFRGDTSRQERRNRTKLWLHVLATECIDVTFLVYTDFLKKVQRCCTNVTDY